MPCVRQRVVAHPGGSVVPADKHDITIAGVDRNAVVLDGADRRRNGILVHADGVSILNLSAHNFRDNAFYWNGADRFRASYLTAWNVRGYGIYVEDGEDGVIDHSYVSGAADARSSARRSADRLLRSHSCAVA